MMTAAILALPGQPRTSGSTTGDSVTALNWTPSPLHPTITGPGAAGGSSGGNAGGSPGAGGGGGSGYIFIGTPGSGGQGGYGQIIVRFRSY